MMQVWAMVDTLQPELNDTERCFVRPFDRNELMGEIDDPRTSHERRVSIGDYLAKNGDARPGVGLDTEGLPDLVWCEVTAGEVRLEGVAAAGLTGRSLDIGWLGWRRRSRNQAGLSTDERNRARFGENRGR
jgi:hypothetical protein